MIFRAIRLFHTIRFLKLKQIYFRIFYRIFPSRFFGIKECEINKKIEIPSFPTYFEICTNDGINYKFLNQDKKINQKGFFLNYSKLWLYNFHYQNDLLIGGNKARLDLSCKIINSWIDSNQSSSGVGWEPYCISLRSVNWMKWMFALPKEMLAEKWLKSLSKQISVLENTMEHHILGNHLLANAKALIFSGVFFDGRYSEEWLAKGLKTIDAELVEQFLFDGSHYELSPMYHSIMLWDLADLIYLCQFSEIPELKTRKEIWVKTFTRGMQWLQNMVHLDREIAFFNDSTFGSAPTIDNLLDYASILNLQLPTGQRKSGLNGQLLKESGYGIIEWERDHKLIVDIAKIGPDYQPGHGHADTLSFELSIFGQRVFVNSGISQYENNSERLRQRSTPAHNTVVVNDNNSSDVWNSFRVGKRAQPKDVQFKTEKDIVQISAYHNGYNKLTRKLLHKREWSANRSNLTITDEIDLGYNSAVAHWHFHPDILIESLENDTFSLVLQNGNSIYLSFEGGNSKITDSTWHPGFGFSVPNKKILTKIFAGKLITRIDWGLD